MENKTKIFLAILLILCLANMPYGYYQFVRIAGLVGFLFLAYIAKQTNKSIELILFIGLAILFQPFYKISFDREVWNIIDLSVGILLLVSVFKPKLIQKD